ncbi:MAG: hypothetical protein SFY81_02205 [Verrucomicrobiota bacterium]|nr:hypothetical protein [Verrucomicrobiota bacterium]
MSLKAFHIIFIIASSLVTLFFGGCSLRNYLADRAMLDLIFVIASIVSLVALWIYGQYFLKKLKHISYL